MPVATSCPKRDSYAAALAVGGNSLEASPLAVANASAAEEATAWRRHLHSATLR